MREVGQKVTKNLFGEKSVKTPIFALSLLPGFWNAAGYVSILRPSNLSTCRPRSCSILSQLRGESLYWLLCLLHLEPLRINMPLCCYLRAHIPHLLWLSYSPQDIWVSLAKALVASSTDAQKNKVPYWTEVQPCPCLDSYPCIIVLLIKGLPYHKVLALSSLLETFLHSWR